MLEKRVLLIRLSEGSYGERHGENRTGYGGG